MAHDLFFGLGLAATVFVIVVAAVLARRPPPKWAWPLLGIGALTCLLLLFRVSWTGYAFYDFKDVYYRAGVAALHHDPAALRQLSSNGVMGFVNLPVVAYLFAPFALLGPWAASGIFTLIGIGLSVAAWQLLARMTQLPVADRWLLAVLFLVNGPLINGLKFGNLSYVLLFPLAAGLALIRAGRPGWAGALLALAAIIKPPLALFGVFFLLRRDWRGVLAFSAVGLAAGLASLAIFGWDDNLHWFQVCILQFSRGWLGTFTTDSIAGFLIRLGADPGMLTTWSPYLPTPGQRLLATGLTGLLFLIAGLAVVRWPMRQSAVRADAEAAQRRDLQYLLVICLALTASPLSWSHYFTWLLMPAAFFLRSRGNWPAPARWLGWVAIVIASLPIAWPPTIANPVLVRLYVSLVASNLLFGALLWLGLVAWRLLTTGGLLDGPRASRNTIVHAGTGEA